MSHPQRRLSGRPVGNSSINHIKGKISSVQFQLLYHSASQSPGVSVGGSGTRPSFSSRK